jgi:hypothetical protein
MISYSLQRKSRHFETYFVSKQHPSTTLFGIGYNKKLWIIVISEQLKNDSYKWHTYFTTTDINSGTSRTSSKDFIWHISYDNKIRKIAVSGNIPLWYCVFWCRISHVSSLFLLVIFIESVSSIIFFLFQVADIRTCISFFSSHVMIIDLLVIAATLEY